MRAQLLSAVPSRGPLTADARYLDESSRLSLCRAPRGERPVDVNNRLRFLTPIVTYSI